MISSTTEMHIERKAAVTGWPLRCTGGARDRCKALVSNQYFTVENATNDNTSGQLLQQLLTGDRPLGGKFVAAVGYSLEPNF